MDNNNQNQIRYKFLTFFPASLGFLGMLDSVYLAAKHYLGSAPPCVLLKGCEVVTTSKFATIGGISVAVFGAIYYFTVLIMSIVYLNSKNARLLNILSKFTIIGVLATAWFLYLQIFVLKALCLYCLVSAFSSLFLFGIVYFLHWQNKPENNGFNLS